MAPTILPARLKGALHTGTTRPIPTFGVRSVGAIRMPLGRQGGQGRIDGTTKLKGVTSNIPVSAIVRLYRDFDGALMATTVSDAVTGAYSFTGLDERHQYTPLAIDITASYRAVVADRVPTTHMT